MANTYSRSGAGWRNYAAGRLFSLAYVKSQETNSAVAWAVSAGKAGAPMRNGSFAVPVPLSLVTETAAQIIGYVAPLHIGRPGAAYAAV